MGQCSLHPLMWKKKSSDVHTPAMGGVRSHLLLLKHKDLGGTVAFWIWIPTLVWWLYFIVRERNGQAGWWSAQCDLGGMVTWGSLTIFSETESESRFCLGIPSRIHVTLSLREVGDYRKIRESQSLGRRKSHWTLFFRVGGNEASSIPGRSLRHSLQGLWWW